MDNQPQLSEDLVRIIGLFSSRRDLAVMCCVCIVWHDAVQSLVHREAGEMLFRRLCSLAPTLNLTRGIVVSLSLFCDIIRLPNAVVQDFVRRPGRDEWQSFERLAAGVWTFTDSFYVPSTMLGPYSRTILTTRSERTPIFPNLKVLYMGTRPATCPYMSPSVTSLVWKLDESFAAFLPGMMESVYTRMPQIQTLKLEFQRHGDMERHLAVLLRSLPLLTKVIFPLHGMSFKLLDATLKAPNVEDIDIDFDMVLDRMDLPNDLSSSYTPDSDVFMDNHTSALKLRRLGLTAPNFQSVTNILCRPALKLTLRVLVRLLIRLPLDGGRNLNEFRSMANMLSSNAVCMEDLQIWMNPGGSEGRDLKHGPMLKIGLSDLLVLCRIGSLIALAVHDALVFNLTNADMYSLSRSLPGGMRYLHLNHHPFLLTRPRATVGCLAFFAQNCRNLVQLSICINGTIDEQPAYGIGFSCKFNKLGLGRSLLPKKVERAHQRNLARYLAHLFPTDKVLICSGIDDVTHVSRYGRGHAVYPPTGCQQWKERFDKMWSEVLPLMHLLRSEMKDEEALYRERRKLTAELHGNSDVV